MNGRVAIKTIGATLRSVIAPAALTLWVSFAFARGVQNQTLMLKASGNTLTGSLQGGRASRAK